MCNHIDSLDPDFDWRGHDEPWYEEDDIEHECPQFDEYFQKYLASYCYEDVEWLERNFDLKFGYSPMLELFVLLVPHYGTAWNYVYCQTKIQQAKAELGQKIK